MDNKLPVNIDEILTGIMKPGRYIGGEWNSVRKDWDRSRVRVCLAYPDVYEIGMSYLGLQILYHLINSKGPWLCERVFAPWGDMENRLRERGVGLFSLESRNPISAFDVVGFSLGYELTYTNVLNMLDLGSIPVMASERGDNCAIVIAGGPCALNPVPIRDFIDVFFIGEAEESIVEFLDLYERLKSRGSRRGEILEKAARLDGVYVPVIHGDGAAVRKRIVKDLENAFYPRNPIVPFIQTVHDRVAVEVMRGCPNTCRFCQARSVYAPVRVRSGKKVVEIAAESLASTGHDEVSFLSLSTSNYPHLRDVIDSMNAMFEGKGINISVPSLRVEDICMDLPQKIARNRRTGLTFAPESGSERIRDILDKAIDMEKLNTAVEAAYSHGWRRVKLYFMIGLPGEEMSDVNDIAGVVRAISGAGGKKAGHSGPGRGRMDVSVSINNFVPKPHTPFQWLGMEGCGGLQDKQEYLKERLRHLKVRVSFQDVATSVLEGVLSRGDGSLNPIILDAWRRGARFDAWSETLNMNAWTEAFKNAGFSIYDRAQERFHADRKLPWGFIDACMPEGYFAREAAKTGVVF
ncbi:MAG: TIGR03960 family B12-binding radical SAM protein [Candidatus Omnitrophota bacterium]